MHVSMTWLLQGSRQEQQEPGKSNQNRQPTFCQILSGVRKLGGDGVRGSNHEGEEVGEDVDNVVLGWFPHGINDLAVARPNVCQKRQLILPKVGLCAE